MGSEEINPALARGFKNATYDSTTMSISGTITKILILLSIVTGAFIYSWFYIPYSDSVIMLVAIITFAVAIFTVISPKSAQFSSIIYAAFEGLFLGSISKVFDNFYSGIIIPAILITIVAVIVTLFVYGKKPSIAERTEKSVRIAITTISVTLLMGVLLSFFGIVLPIYENGIIGIVFSLIVVLIATISLIQDYEFILKGAEVGAPKYMEWYSAFGLMVTLVWLYTELIRFLGKIFSVND